MVEYKEIEIWKSYSEYLKELNEIKDPYGADYEKLTYLLKKLETMYFGYESSQSVKNEFGDMEKYTVKGYFGEVYSSMIRELGNKKSIFKFCKENENAYVKNKMGVTLTEDKYVEMCNNLPNTNLLTNIVSNGPSWVFERTRITGADDYYVKTPSHEDYVNLTKSFLEFTKKNGAGTFGE